MTRAQDEPRAVERASAAWLAVALLAIGVLFSAIIPPFQSPDEFDHVKRAYLLSQGQFMLTTPPGESSGGMLDFGLASYATAYSVLNFKPERKLSADEVRAASRIEWAGEKGFSPAPGTGYYFPLVYLPQAIGLGTGQLLGWTVERSYYLARLLALASIAAILFVSFSLVSPGPLTLALLVMPMTLFQFASASLDGISTALGILALSAFFRLSIEPAHVSRWLLPCLVLSVALVTACRVHLLPLWALVAIASLREKSRKPLLLGASALLLVLAWLATAIATTVDTRQVVGAPTVEVISYYVRQPLALVDVLATTLATRELLLFYRDSFIGVLGWLDTRFSRSTYFHFSLCITLIAFLSASWAGIRAEWVERTTLLLAAFCSCVLVFCALLVTWSPHPAAVIQGVQGRYFLVPAFMLSLALSGGRWQPGGIPRRFAFTLLTLLVGFSLFSTPRLLIDRYYRAATHAAPSPGPVGSTVLPD